MRETVQINVQIPEELRKQVKAVAALQGTSISEIVRSALEDFVTASPMVVMAKQVESEPNEEPAVRAERQREVE